ncbi:hypothetical protein TWF106_003097 [Orbilia oligospora]|uniref:STEEP1 domain-containing protein n=1 Tax=Orbilia oligospora TaxID=2813651 RepID=A0A6G1MNU4_ORBOL|nr:hypothetical protein TWF191_005167 [Orbilia oligospora]KAF3200989.1 hypothetical protein TWF106_003097 [Orbilia oligospora]KAF3205044.1 hypothetical protein TWF679_009475 [Orbilia oligospora]KAF3263667.1 hypothetical protein TWF192_005942 [Orbilia oligospora]
MDMPSIFTYHCICSHLILATTRDIFKLPCRQRPGLDGALIVPLPPPPRSADSENESDDNEEDDGDEDEDEDDGDAREEENEEREKGEGEGEEHGERMDIDRRSQETSSGHVTESQTSGVGQSYGAPPKEEPEPKDYTLLLSSIRDRRPCVIRREDGFEKRLLWRCGRCRLIFGYQIYDEGLEELTKGEDDEINRQKKSQSNKNYYVYILPGGLTTAADMGSLTERDLQLVEE